MRKDPAIINATQKRKEYTGKREEFSDDAQARVLDLPDQLKPLPTGLTADQFQVYQDFGHLIESEAIHQTLNQNEQPSQQELDSQTPQGNVCKKPQRQGGQSLTKKELWDLGVQVKDLSAKGPDGHQ